LARTPCTAAFSLDSALIDVLVLSRDQLTAVIDNKPTGFGERPGEYLSDAIFLLGISATQAVAVFDPREGVDTVWPGDGMIDAQRLSSQRTKSRLNKAIGTAAYTSMTIRSWSITTALLDLLSKRDADDEARNRFDLRLVEYEEQMPKTTRATSKKSTRSTSKESNVLRDDVWTEGEKAAIQETAQERKRESRRDPAAAREEGEHDVFAKIAEMAPADRVMAERIHAIVMATAPELVPKTWYGMPAYAKDGKIICFFKAASKYKERYATFGFDMAANLEEGTMWPTGWCLTELTPADERRIAALVKKAVS
jgi:hypothetical protein